MAATTRARTGAGDDLRRFARRSSILPRHLGRFHRRAPVYSDRRTSSLCSWVGELDASPELPPHKIRDQYGGLVQGATSGPGGGGSEAVSADEIVSGRRTGVWRLVARCCGTALRTLPSGSGR